ncbi:hypothetical protein M3603_15325 [Rummeliibacillus stabekisii]|uniref:hypothetical protein n=1 Tax=Rummeliibacillus stabekisii TaxID=241244 RepID=UPI0020402725|nr:hypothetical protein [Rummeliibacillus stabekisii]MCM3317989.1 hypothetical protein [Rummeliibacillus stabekisii]
MSIIFEVMDYVIDVNGHTYMVVPDTFKKRDDLKTLTIREAQVFYSKGLLIQKTVECEGEEIFIKI